MAPIPKKLIIVGDGCVGKTSILMVFHTGKYPEEYLPTHMDVQTTITEVNGKSVELSLWDTNTGEEMEALRPLSYPDTDIILMCFSFFQPKSFSNIREKWTPEFAWSKIIYVGDDQIQYITEDIFKRVSVQTFLFQMKQFCPDVPIILVGNKKDLFQDNKAIRELSARNEKPILQEAGQAMANEIGADKYCSAKTAEGIAEILKDAAGLALAHKNKKMKHDCEIH